MPVDAPKLHRTDDDLERTPFANSVARAIRRLDPSEGAVVGLFGPWGSGKTTVLNFIREALAEKPALPVFNFNPWLYSGTEELLSRFFLEVAAQFRTGPGRLEKAGNQFAEYGQTLTQLSFIPVAGVVLSGIGTAAGVYRQWQKTKKSIAAEREKVEKLLRQLDSPVVVAIDDVDRLPADQVRQMLQLVRLTGSFPNLIYLVAMDRRRVEKVLDDDPAEGRAYLEKIVELPYDIPEIPPQTLLRILRTGLANLESEQSTALLDLQEWKVVEPALLQMFATLRDIKRFLATLPTSLDSLAGEVALADVLGLEAVRVLEPDVHAALWRASAALTALEGDAETTQATHDVLNALMDRSGESRHNALQKLLGLLFPAIARHYGGPTHTYAELAGWRRQRRVASPDVLVIYLTRTVGPAVAPTQLVELAFSALDNESEFSTVVAQLSEDVLEDLFVRLEAYSEDFPRSGIEGTVAVLLELYPRLRQEDRAPFDPPADLKLDRVLLRLLRQLPDGDRTDAVRRVWQRPLPLYSKMRLARLVGYRPNAGHRLIPQPDAEELELDLTTAIRRSATSLLKEHRPLDLLWEAVRQDPNARGSIDAALQDDALVRELLIDALVSVTTLSSAPLQRRYELDWKALTMVFGDEGRLVTRLKQMDRVEPEGDRERDAWDLANEYVAGYRPGPVVPAYTQISYNNSPDNVLAIFAGPLSPAPLLVIRAVSSFTPPSRGSSAGIDPSFRKALQSDLNGSSLSALTELAWVQRFGEVHAEAWQRDPDVRQTSRQAGLRRRARLGEDWQLLFKVAFLLPEGRSPARLFCDVALMPNSSDSGVIEQAPPNRLSLADVVHTLAIEVRVAAEQLPILLNRLGTAAPYEREAIEIHAAAPRGVTLARRAITLADSIDLEPLGEGAEPPTELHAAVTGNVDLTADDAPANLIISLLRGQVLDWGYVDPDSGLPPLGSILA